MSFTQNEYFSNNDLVARIIYNDIMRSKLSPLWFNTGCIYNSYRSKGIDILADKCYENNIENDIRLTDPNIQDTLRCSRIMDTIEIMISSISLKISGRLDQSEDPIPDLLKNNLALNYDEILTKYQDILNQKKDLLNLSRGSASSNASLTR